jgi:hypothetical protein
MPRDSPHSGSKVLPILDVQLLFVRGLGSLGFKMADRSVGVHVCRHPLVHEIWVCSIVVVVVHALAD